MSEEVSYTSSVKELVKQLPVLKKRQLTQKQHNNARISFGHKGEELACAFLTGHGYSILERNLRLNTYEVDIIALDTQAHELVFVEVKRRRNTQYGQPFQAVGYKKLHSMHRVARAYLTTHIFPLDYRFDIISIVGTNIEHFANVTWFT